MTEQKNNLVKNVLNCPKCGKGEMNFNGLQSNIGIASFEHTCVCGHREWIDTIYPKFEYHPEYQVYEWTSEGTTKKKKKRGE